MEDKKRSRKKQLFQNIIRQTEFYFSSANLSKDRFLSKRLHENKGHLEISTLLTFNKIKSLTCDIDVLKKALSLSEKLELSEDKSTVKSKIPYKPKDNIDSCTIYVEHLPPEADIEWLDDIFSSYGHVDYISLPKFSNNKIKGFAFIEFDVPESAKKAVQEFQNAGCYLSTEMAPEDLCSISSYDKQESDQSESKPETMDDETPVADGGSTEETPSNDQIEDSKGQNGKLRKEKRKIEDETEDNELVKKAKLETESNEISQPCANENSPIEDSTDQETQCETSNENSKKRRRKKKKPKKDKVTPVSSGLQILSKNDWKRLRNSYLNMQREKMKSIKKHLLTNKKEIKCFKNQDFNKTSTTIEFPKTVVKLKLREPVINVKEFKSEIKKDSSVKYIDVKEGATEVHVRLSSPEEARLFCLDSRWASAIIITGNEERFYWDKINENRSSKLKKADNNGDIQPEDSVEGNGQGTTNDDDTPKIGGGNKCPNKPLEMKLNTIVKISLSQPVLDIKQFKSDIKLKTPNALYIDVKEGSSVAFVRMDSSDDAAQFCLDPDWPNAKVIEGDEEQDYWEKIQLDRSSKYESKIKRKKKGKQKLIRKAENVIRTHIIISD